MKAFWKIWDITCENLFTRQRITSFKHNSSPEHWDIRNKKDGYVCAMNLRSEENQPSVSRYIILAMRKPLQRSEFNITFGWATYWKLFFLSLQSHTCARMYVLYCFRDLLFWRSIWRWVVKHPKVWAGDLGKDRWDRRLDPYSPAYWWHDDCSCRLLPQTISAGGRFWKHAVHQGGSV